MAGYAYNPALTSSANYAAWLAAGRPPTDASGQTLDVRGAPMEMSAWDNTSAALGNGAFAVGDGIPNAAPMGAAPLYGHANPGMPGMQAPGNPSAGLPQTSNGATQPQTLGQIANGGGMMYAGGSPTFNENMGAGVPGGNMSIPAAPGNPYTLNIGNYLNPMMNYAMQQGAQSILNSQAARGLVDSGDTLKQLYGY